MACSAIVVLINPPDMSNGDYLSQQHFNFDGTSINWGSGLTGGSSFFVQAFEDFGNVSLTFGEWNGGPYQVTSNPILFGASVELADPQTGQRNTNGAPITNQYFGIKYDAGDGDFNFGWINISTIEAFEAGRINSVAFNTMPNADILAGQTAIPEPKAVAFFMAFSALAIVVFRRF